jgi:hypothetical protein
MPFAQLQQYVQICLDAGLIGEIAASPNVSFAVSGHPQLLRGLCEACVANDMLDEAVALLSSGGGHEHPQQQQLDDEFLSNIVNRAAINRMWSGRLLLQESELAILPAMRELVRRYPNHLTARRPTRWLAKLAAEAGDMELLEAILSEVVHQDDYRMQLSLQATLVPILSKGADARQLALAGRLFQQLTTFDVSEPIASSRSVDPIFRHRGLPAAVLRLAANHASERAALQWARLLLPRMVADPSFMDDADCLLTLTTKLSTGGIAEMKTIVSEISRKNDNDAPTAANVHLATAILSGFGHSTDMNAEQAQFETAIRDLLTKHSTAVIPARSILPLIVAPGAAGWKYATLWRVIEGEQTTHFSGLPGAFAVLAENVPLNVPFDRIFEAWRKLEAGASSAARDMDKASLRGWEHLYAALLRLIRVHAPNVPLKLEQERIAEILDAAAAKRLEHSVDLTRAMCEHFQHRQVDSDKMLAFVQQHQTVLDDGAAALLFVDRLFRAGTPNEAQLQALLEQLQSHGIVGSDVFLPVAIYILEVYQQGRASADMMVSYLRCIQPLVSSSKDYASLLDHLAATSSTLGHDLLMLSALKELRLHNWAPTRVFVDTIVKHCVRHNKVQSAWKAVELLMEMDHWAQLSVGLFATLLRAAAQASLWEQTEHIWRCYSEVHSRLPSSFTDQLDIRVAYVYCKFCQGELDAANDFTRKLLRNMEGAAAKQFMERLVSTIAPINWDFAAQVFYEMLKQRMLPEKEVFDVVMKNAKAKEHDVRASFLKQQYTQLLMAEASSDDTLIDDSGWEPSR